uniref:RING-type E3 ubiquitin transferase n=1 Tax=Davidia involucrata TaxID=16924 RepID=A0A5B7BU46_DAVIN
MSYSYTDQPPSCCSTASAELKLYQAFIFSVPIFFTFILVLLFYLFYLRRRRVDWSSLRMRTLLQTRDDISGSELGVKKELREMLPVIIFKESFSVRDTQCSVCLGDYQAEDRLQQIPACGHSFHMDCIDHWLATHTTCPLCRLSLLASVKASTKPPDSQAETSCRHSHTDNDGEISLQTMPQYCEDPQISQQSSESSNRDDSS